MLQNKREREIFRLMELSRFHENGFNLPSASPQFDEIEMQTHSALIIKQNLVDFLKSIPNHLFFFEKARKRQISAESLELAYCCQGPQITVKNWLESFHCWKFYNLPVSTFGLQPSSTYLYSIAFYHILLNPVSCSSATVWQKNLNFNCISLLHST